MAGDADPVRSAGTAGLLKGAAPARLGQCPLGTPSNGEIASPLFLCVGTAVGTLRHERSQTMHLGIPLAENSRESDFDTDQVALRVSRREDGILTRSGRMLRFPVVYAGHSQSARPVTSE